MGRAQQRDASRSHKLYFRKDVLPPGHISPTASSTSSSGDSSPVESGCDRGCEFKRKESKMQNCCLALWTVYVVVLWKMSTKKWRWKKSYVERQTIFFPLWPYLPVDSGRRGRYVPRVSGTHQWLRWYITNQRNDDGGNPMWKGKYVRYTNSLMSSLNARGVWRVRQGSGAPHIFDRDAEPENQYKCMFFVLQFYLCLNVSLSTGTFCSSHLRPKDLWCVFHYSISQINNERCANCTGIHTTCWIG